MKRQVCNKCRRTRILRAKTFYYVAVSDGVKRKYTDRDRERRYKSGKILDPKRFSYANLFINAMLQPSQAYRISRNKLVLKSKETPEKGVPIVLQFIRICN